MGEIAQPGGEPTQSPRGGGERCRRLTKPSPSRGGGRIVFVNGLVTFQCPIVPAWRSDRIKSELLYSMYLRIYDPILSRNTYQFWLKSFGRVRCFLVNPKAFTKTLLSAMLMGLSFYVCNFKTFLSLDQTFSNISI